MTIVTGAESELIAFIYMLVIAMGWHDSFYYEDKKTPLA